MAVLRIGDQVPLIDPGAWVALSATVIGNVTVAAEASVYYAAVVRADREAIRIGAGSNLQDLVVVHADPGLPTLVGANVTVGHSAVLHGCTVEDGALIGIGAVVMNGAVIGAGSLVGAGAVVPGGTRIPERSLVLGAPAKVRRQLTDGEVAANLDNARRYVELIPLHRSATEL